MSASADTDRGTSGGTVPLPRPDGFRKASSLRQCRATLGATVDSTMTVRLFTQIKDEAERLLDSLGPLLPPMSSASQAFSTHEVAYAAQPFPAAADGQASLNVPLHVHTGVMLEEIAGITVRLQHMEQAEQFPEKRKQLRKIGKAVRARRFQFDPHNEGEVIAMIRKIGQYSRAIHPALLPVRS
jgi:hypothetical protein